jgi:hypothetical protein
VTGNGRKQSYFIQLERGLLDAAEALRRDTHFGPAVVTAQAAVEVVTEFVICDALRDRGAELEEPFRMFIRTFSLRDERLRSLYKALIGDDITEAGFWRELQAHMKRRNEVAHGEMSVSAEDAERSLRVAREAVNHLIGRWAAYVASRDEPHE